MQIAEETIRKKMRDTRRKDWWGARALKAGPKEERMSGIAVLRQRGDRYSHNNGAARKFAMRGRD